MLNWIMKILDEIGYSISILRRWIEPLTGTIILTDDEARVFLPLIGEDPTDYGL